jgi:hypothetical protein
LRAAFIEGGEDVEREAEELERDEDDEQVLGSDEEHHAGSGDQNEEDEFTYVLGEVGVCGDEQSDDGEGEQPDLHEMRERVRD